MSGNPDRQGSFSLVHYETTECVTDLPFDPSNETMWATQQQIAGLFGVDRTVVGRHLKNVFTEGELEETAVCAKFARTAADGKTYLIQHYNLDAVLSVGYRVSSKKATDFRRWATTTLDLLSKPLGLGWGARDSVIRRHARNNLASALVDQV